MALVNGFFCQVHPTYPAARREGIQGVWQWSKAHSTAHQVAVGMNGSRAGQNSSWARELRRLAPLGATHAGGRGPPRPLLGWVSHCTNGEMPPPPSKWMTGAVTPLRTPPSDSTTVLYLPHSFIRIHYQPFPQKNQWIPWLLNPVSLQY